MITPIGGPYLSSKEPESLEDEEGPAEEPPPPGWNLLLAESKEELMKGIFFFSRGFLGFRGD